MTNNYKDWKDDFREFCRKKGIGGLAYLTIVSYFEPLIEQIIEGEREDVLAKVMKAAPNIAKACHCCGGGIQYHWKGLRQEIAAQTNSLQE